MSVNRYKDGQLTLIAGSGDSNTFTGTKAEVEQAIAAGKIKENWTVYITDDLEDFVNTPGGSNCDCKVEYITQEQYDLLPEDKLTNDIEYRITDNNPTTPSAKNMAYDGSASGIEATNVQDAIDAVSEELDKRNMNTINSPIALTFQEEYVCPRDGYAYIRRSDTDGKYIVLLISNVWMQRISNKSDFSSIYVHKGTVISSAGNDSEATIRFYPLNHN